MLNLLFISTAIFKLKFLWIDLTLFAFLLSLPLLLKERLRFAFPILIALMGWLALSVYATYQSGNVDSLSKALRAIVSFINISLIGIYLKKRLSGRQVIVLIGLVLLVHPFFIITEALFPVQSVIFSVLFEWTGHSNHLRFRGLFNSTSSAGIFLGFCALIWQYLYFVNGIKLFSIPIVLAYILFPFTALTGLFVAIIGLLLLPLEKMIAKRIAFSTFIFIPAVVILSASLVFFPVTENKYIGLVQGRIFTLVGVDGYSTSSGNPQVSFGKLRNSYSFPDSNLILGNGHPSKAENATTASDAGIVANVHKFGLVGLLAIGSILFLVGRRNEVARILSICFLVAFFKNDFFLSRIVFDLILLVSIVGNRKMFFRENKVGSLDV